MANDGWVTRRLQVLSAQLRKARLQGDTAAMMILESKLLRIMNIK